MLTYRETERRTDRYTYRNKNRQIDKQTDHGKGPALQVGGASKWDMKKALPSRTKVAGAFPHRFFSIPYSLFTPIISISLSVHLVLLAPVNSCELHNYHLVLSFLFMYSSSGLSTDVFFLIKRI